MKKILHLLYVAAVIILFASSCGKDGAIGPQGSTVTKGAIGPAGPAGANGANGSVIYAGSTAPPTTTGVVGDFYLNTATGILFGPKAASGWGTGFSLVGPAGAKGATGATGVTGATGATGNTGAAGATGATGAAGNTVLSGTAIPAASLGKVGDFYLDITNYMLYGPKVAAGWGTAVSLQGSAEVLYSGWNFGGDPRDSTVDLSNWLIENVSAPALTQDILNKGAVEVYMLYLDNLYSLPYSSNVGGVYNTVGFWPRVGTIIINRVTTANTYIGFPGYLEFRYVIIPGGKALALKNHIDLTDYNAVRKFYKIPD